MSDPTRLPEDEQTKATLQAQTEEINRLELLLAQHGQSAQSITESDEPPAPERLFSRKTLFGWAFATLLVVFLIRIVLPEVFETVKQEIRGHLDEPRDNSAAPVVAPVPPTTTTTTTTTRIVIPAPEVPEPPVIKVEVRKR
ncbi:MAG TPA: hypothetical protein VM053_07715 [Gemmatimonadaceae bacterium]|nr:hypothetical protein [Gemmatimonadaceae bacterium]